MLRRLMVQGMQAGRNRLLSGTSSSYKEHASIGKPILHKTSKFSPTVLENSVEEEDVPFDVSSRLLKDHIIMLNGHIEDDVSS